MEIMYDSDVDSAHPEALARGVAAFLIDQKCDDVCLLDIGKQSSFADYLIIAEATSQARITGVSANLSRFLAENGIYPRSGRNRQTGTDWLLLDCGFIVINIMLESARKFYDLEGVWHKSVNIL